MTWPKISIVTPSYNQGRFLEQTISSVLGQGYPNLEYIIMDGGSSDESVNIIRRHESQINYWESHPDQGQADAINRGFDRSSGEILAWLNSDDVYLPGILFEVAKHLDIENAQILFGNSLRVREHQPDAFGSNVELAHARFDLEFVDYIIQPSSFWTRRAWNLTGRLDVTLRYAFDWDWYVRARKAGAIFTPDPAYFSVYRLHEAHKTGSGGDDRVKEIANVLRNHAGSQVCDLYLTLASSRKYNWIRGVQRWLARIRLMKHLPTLLRLMFPRLFRGLSDRQLISFVEMLEPSEKIRRMAH